MRTTWLLIACLLVTRHMMAQTTLPAHANSQAYRDVPVLCYHQVRNREAGDSKNDRVFIMPPDVFEEQMKMLHDSGYHVISADELADHYDKKKSLPPKPIVITFDDGTESQYRNALPVLDKYNFKAVFFIMTVSIGHKLFMDSAQIRNIANRGHIIGCHTWNHKKISLYQQDDWLTELEKPKARLERITGRPVRYFAYPYGICRDDAIERLRQYGFHAAFQLAGGPYCNSTRYGIRRILVAGDVSSKQLLRTLRNIKTNIPGI